MLKDLIRYLAIKWFKLKYKNAKIISNYFSAPISGFYSQASQDAFVYSEFYDQFENGLIPRVFLDVGCNHPTKYSNSYFFEKNLGFKCIAIDPLQTYVAEWKKYRPNSILQTVALGAQQNTMNLSVPEKNWNASEDNHPPDMFSTMIDASPRLALGSWKSISIPVIPARDLLQSNGIKEIGIVSIDVEGYEMEVLKGFDFNAVKIYVAIIENNSRGMMGGGEIRNYMEGHGYIFYARIWGMDDVFVHADLFARKCRC